MQHLREEDLPKKRKKRRRRRRRGGGGWIALAVVLGLFAAIVIGAAGFLSSKLARLDRDGYAEVVDESGNIVTIRQEPTSSDSTGSGVQSSAAKPKTGGVFGVLKGALGVGSKDVVNILLIGSDMRMKHTDDIGRGDVTMLCSLNTRTGAVKLVSFERGTGVPWEGHDWTMLTSFYRFNGPAATTRVVGECFQIDFDGYAHVDFDSFREIINAIGGVDVELDRAEAGALTNSAKQRYFKEGVNHLDGEAALDFCRLRSIDSNWQRTGRQRRTIQAVLTKAKGMNLKQLNDLADTVLPMIDTDLSNETITRLMMNLTKFAGATADQMVVPDRDHILPGGNGYNKADFEYESGRIRELLYN